MLWEVARLIFKIADPHFKETYLKIAFQQPGSVKIIHTDCLS